MWVGWDVYFQLARSGSNRPSTKGWSGLDHIVTQYCMKLLMGSSFVYQKWQLRRAQSNKKMLFQNMGILLLFLNNLPENGPKTFEFREWCRSLFDQKSLITHTYGIMLMSQVSRSCHWVDPKSYEVQNIWVSKRFERMEDVRSRLFRDKLSTTLRVITSHCRLRFVSICFLAVWQP